MKNKLLYLKAVVLYAIARVIVSFVPLKKNKFFCISMNGNSYGDNIKCLSDYIQSDIYDAQIVWAFSSVFYKKISCTEKKVKLFTFLYYYHILTSKYILNNGSLSFVHLIKRNGQICVNTWHGTALKRIGLDIFKTQREGFLYKYFGFNYVKYNSKITDVFISGSHYMSDIIKEKLAYKGEILEIGTPRNDIFFRDNTEIRNRVCSFFGIDNNSKIILYAPTFRSDYSFKWYNIDLLSVKNELDTLFGENYEIMVRLHPSLMRKEKEFGSLYPYKTVNASIYPDMQELLSTVDVLITDYSSCMFDFMYSNKVVIQYVPDRATYNRGFYLDIDTLPFVIINNNSEIHDKLSKLDLRQYQSDLGIFIKKIGSVEDGHATRNTVEFILNKTK